MIPVDGRPRVGDFLIAMGIAAFMGVCVALVFSACVPPTLTPAQAADLGKTGIDISQCQAEGRASRSYHVYMKCMCDTGEHTGPVCDPILFPPSSKDGGADGNQRD